MKTIKNERKLLTVLVCVLLAVLTLGLLAGCTAEKKKKKDTGLGNGWKPESHMKLKYATQFSVDYYKDGYKLIKLHDGSKFLIVPEGKKAPKGISKDIEILQQPLDNIYLAATASMCLFDSLDAIDNIKYSGAEADEWYIQDAKTAMQEGKITYAGKYSQPDYEMLMAGNCDVAIESTMINHVPEVKKKLQEFNIPVFMDQSSMEKHPLGRTEWIKVYGAMLNKEDQADKVFDQQVKILNGIDNKKTGKTVAFFNIASSGQVVVRKSGDYVSKMIELAGGKYIFKNIGDPTKATSTVTIDMEDFYKQAKNADVLIYNSTIEGSLGSLQDLEELNPLMKDFKAVKNGNVWCTGENLYQETTGFGQMVQDIHTVLTEKDPPDDSLTYLHRLR